MATYTIKPGDTLSQIANQFKTDVSSLAKTNNIANPNLIRAGASLNIPDIFPSNTSAVNVNVPSTFDASQLGQTKPLNLPPTPTPTPVPDITRMTIPEIMQQANTEAVQPPTQAETFGSELQNRIMGIAEKLTGRRAAQVQAEQTAKVPEYQKQLTDITAQIKQLQNDATAQTVGLYGQGRGITTGILDRQAGAIERDRAIKALQLNSIASTIQGNLALAQDYADRAVDAEFSPLEEQLNYFKTALELNRDNLSREDKKRAEALGIQLQERERLLVEQKDAKKQILDVVQAAAQKNADALTLNKIREAKTPEEATALAVPFLGADFRMKQEQQQFENDLKMKEFALDSQYKRAQIANIQSEINNRGGSGGAKYKPNEILAFAQQYAANGKIPTGIPKSSFGLISQVAKELPKPEGTLVNQNTGITPDLSAAEQEGLSALYDIQKRLPALKNDFDKMVPGLISGTVGNLFPSKVKQDYLTQRDEILSLLLKARSGAAVSEQEYARYKKLLPTTFNKTFFLGGSGVNKIDNFLSSIQNSLDTKLQTSGNDIYGYSKVKIGDQEYTVGDVVSNGNQQARVNPDGTLTIIQ